MGYLPQHSLDNLKKYAYKGVDKSLFSRYVLNPFWTWFVTLWPLSVAPNTTLDAIDGKQARRTGMAGPLGEMFDHGCDALNTTLEVILASRALGLGRSWWTVSSQIATLANFYLTTWEEYHTGQLFLGYFSGPVEGIIMIVTIYMISGYYGPQFWEQGIWSFTHLKHLPLMSKLPDLPLNESFMVFGAFGLGFNILHSYLNVYAAQRKGSGGHQPASRTPPLLLLLPFVASALIQIAWLSHPRYNDSWILGSAAFVPFLCAWGLQFAHQVGRMILAHVTKDKFPIFDWVWAWSALGAIDANLPRVFGISPLIQTTPRRTTLFVWLTLVVSAVVYARFVVLVIRDITNFLGIACFTVRKKDGKGQWHDARPDKVH
ncbi:unnamed protein product [Cyclocybe aegerita]|uniref:Ethanolaminephosphotransferase n=1 Tax=Cyclocybe aegerita TaxID=1973307 RepID=A0A8S0VWX4_CYCAE|nr:unnamed protein product [Cyclocybe aegerita]